MSTAVRGKDEGYRRRDRSPGAPVRRTTGATARSTGSPTRGVLLGKSDMERSNAVPHVLHPKSEKPAYVKQFPIPASHLHFINEQIDKLLALGAIREDWASPHNSPVFAVKKPHSDELRFVIDMSKVNEIIWYDFHSFMDVNSCLQRLGGLESKFLSALDLVNA